LNRKKLIKIREEIAALPTLAARVRAAAKHVGRFDYDALENLMPGENYKRIKQAVFDFKKTGEVNALRPGFFEYAGRECRRTLLDVVWHLVRSHRGFSTDEIQRLSGAERRTTLEYLHCLRMLGYLRQVRRGQWQLIKDPGPQTPTNTGKCQRLRKLRLKGQ